MHSEPFCKGLLLLPGALTSLFHLRTLLERMDLVEAEGGVAVDLHLKVLRGSQVLVKRG